MRFPLITLFVALVQAMGAWASNPQAPSHLRTCDKVAPVGTEINPFFGWYINDPDDNEIQSAYQVVVASAFQMLSSGKADIWDSGKTKSRSQNYIGIKGKTLLPGTRYFWKVRTWDKNGNVSPWSTVAYFDTGLFTANDWAGAIWIKRDTKDANDYTWFRKEIVLNGKPVKRAIVYLSAYHNYEFYINGNLAGKGLAYHYPQYAYYNAYDVTQQLKARNTLAAQTHWYGGGQGRPKGDRGFLLKLVVQYADGTVAQFGTDKSWKQSAVEAFNPLTRRRNGEGVGYVDVIDSRKLVENWNMPGFNDQYWKYATEIGAHPVAPFTGQLQADLTRLKEKRIKPVSIKSLGKGSYIIDLGKIYAGMPEISFQGGKPGDTVSMRAGFVLKEDGSVSEKINQSTDLSYFFVLNGAKAVFKPVVYLGYRYLQVDNSPVELNDTNVAFIVRYYELQPEKAYFASSDKMLDQVWNLMVHSLTLGAQEGFVDTPTREKGAFLGDGWSQGVAAMLTLGERAMNHRVLLEFLDSQDQYWPDGQLNSVYPNVDGKRDIPDFTQQYLIWAWDYYMLTGNVDFLATNYQKLRKVASYVDTYKRPGTGLIHNLAGGNGGYKYGIVDWPPSMRYDYDVDAEARTVISALAYADFDIISKIAAVTGNNADAKLWMAKADSLKTAFNKSFINSQGIYIDGLMADGSPSKHVSQHANMFPLALGMVPDANREKVITVVKDKKMSVGMVTVRFLPEALGEAGEGAHLWELYTNPQWDGWAQTLSRGGTATWESWDALERNNSMCHPWGTSGLGGMANYILGVKTLKAQHELIQIRPLDFEGKLLAATGILPTDKGDIKVEWKDSAKGYRLVVTTPDNVSAEVYIPRGKSRFTAVKVDGKMVNAKVIGKYFRIENIGSGKHIFERL